MDTANNLDDYEQQWKYHIDQLAKLAIPAKISYERYKATKVELELWLDDAITNLRNSSNGKR